jgi:hypothetical protein
MWIFCIYTFALIFGAIWAELHGEAIGLGTQKKPVPDYAS